MSEDVQMAADLIGETLSLPVAKPRLAVARPTITPIGSIYDSVRKPGIIITFFLDV